MRPRASSPQERRGGYLPRRLLGGLVLFLAWCAAGSAPAAHELPAGAKQLTFLPFTDRHPAWSPDGEQIVFDSNRGGHFHIWIMRSDGGEARPLTSGSWHDSHPSFSPDGQRIAFDSDRTGAYQVWVINRDGGKPRQITHGSNWHISLGWSPDGASLAYAENNAGQLELLVTAVDGGADAKPRLLSFGKKFGRQIAWSPDGQFIAYDSFAAGNYDIWLMRRDGSDARPLTNGPKTEHFPRWNRRDSRIYYLPHGTGEGSHGLWSMRSDGSDRRLATPSVSFAGGLDISPDGRSIVFDAVFLGESNIYVAPLGEASGPQVGGRR